MIDFLTSLLVGLVIAVVTSILTVHLALLRFRQEKLWEKRTVAYERLIEALYHSKEFNDVHIEAMVKYRDVPKQIDDELRKKVGKARQEIEKAANIGAFLLSSEAIDRVKLYRKEAETASQETDWTTYLFEDQDTTNRCLQDMIAIAKKRS